ncbi:hypothetical protein C2857_000396 [Epichloe festucae Fl1]|uniref:Uncharacterized protein n=1 Tax=Epichloe festucae (strain Fl1) TaxID=877507 RepID=A0A7S9KR86_EPIFF|nr:hypothetical protein C2857_000396 [Epichloe festucae Fl1]
MRSHHHLSVLLLLLAGSIAAAAPRQECISTHSDTLAESSSCGDANIVRQCLSSLSSFDRTHLQACHVRAGCSPSQAAEQTEHTINRCNNDMTQVHELRRRGRATLPAGAKPTTSSNNNNAAPVVMPRDTATPTTTNTNTNKNKSGPECFHTGTTSTTSCISETVDGKVKTRDCHPVPLTTSDCLRGYICTIDSNHVDVCMEAMNSLDTGGLIIAIVFGSFVATGMGYLAFACCRERKHHKKTAAKAEAVALARAATKKQRAQDVARAPLMQQTQHHHGPNPFQDQSGHA